MAWFGRTTPVPLGILASRQRAQPALLRMFSRARRHQTPLALVAIGASPEAAAGAHQLFLCELAAELRLCDLAWWEPGGVVLVLLEAAASAAALERMQRRALASGARPRWRMACFPQQGLTLDALLQEVQWPR
ncbi:MAG: hypothetical protein ACRD01_15565 [Terriglobales bacterium]